MSGDEADDDRDRTATRVRDFVEKEGSVPRSPESVSDGKARKKRDRENRHRRRQHRFRKQPLYDEKEPVRDTSLATKESGQEARVGFVTDTKDEDATDAPPSRRQALRQLSTRAIAKPSILSDNVFLSPGPTHAPPATNVAPGLRRTRSLPDVTRRSQSKPREPGTMNVVPFTRPIISQAKRAAIDTEGGDMKLEMSRTAAIVMLLISTAFVAICAELLVDSIPHMAENSDVSQAFIGLIILPIVGNAAEHVTAVTVATKNKMDLAIGVAVGSSIQIALFVTPLVVLLGWILGREMTLFFNIFETISLFVTAFVINFLILDGRSNYLEGALLIASYVIIA